MAVPHAALGVRRRPETLTTIARLVRVQLDSIRSPVVQCACVGVLLLVAATLASDHG
jgi:hypothetical protein